MVVTLDFEKSPKKSNFFLFAPRGGRGGVARLKMYDLFCCYYAKLDFCGYLSNPENTLQTYEHASSGYILSFERLFSASALVLVSRVGGHQSGFAYVMWP